jgi:hypothetical protein
MFLIFLMVIKHHNGCTVATFWILQQTANRNEVQMVRQKSAFELSIASSSTVDSTELRRRQTSARSTEGVEDSKASNAPSGDTEVHELGAAFDAPKFEKITSAHSVLPSGDASARAHV